MMIIFSILMVPRVVIVARCYCCSKQFLVTMGLIRARRVTLQICILYKPENSVILSRGGTLRISGCGCAARTLEPLAYTRASFSWILLPYTRVNSWFPWSSQPTDQFLEK